MENKVLVAGVVVLVLGLAFVVLGSASSPSQTTPQGTPQSNEAFSDSGDVKEFEITAYQWAFSPSEIRVKKGDKVRLKVKSVDVAHGLAIPAYGVNTYLEPGKEVVVEFVADKSGAVEGVCSVYCGPGHGNMRVSIIVE